MTTQTATCKHCGKTLRWQSEWNYIGERWDGWVHVDTGTHYVPGHEAESEECGDCSQPMEICECAKGLQHP